MNTLIGLLASIIPKRAAEEPSACTEDVSDRLSVGGKLTANVLEFCDYSGVTRRNG